MGAGEIITIVVVCVIVVAVIAYMIYKKLKGDSIGCDCGSSCGSCPHCNRCKSADVIKEENSDGAKKQSAKSKK